MMLLFLMEEQVFTFFHDFKEVNIDLGLDVYRSIQSLSIGGEYVIRGGAFGDTTVRRVDYSISDGRCVVGDRVFGLLANGDVDFSRQKSTEYTLHFTSGDCDFIQRVYAPCWTHFNLREHLEDVFGGSVVRLEHYDTERYYISDIKMDVWMDCPVPVCSVDGCDEEVYQDGMCEECWEMWTLKTGAFE